MTSFRTWRFALPLVLLAEGGCYHYVPAPTPTPTQGTPVRVMLQRPASFDLPQLTAHNIDRVDGEVVRRDPGELLLSATWLQAVTGGGFEGGLWTVGIDDANVAGMEVKTISWWRTGFSLALAVVGTYFGFDALRGTNAGGSQSGGGTQTR